MLCEVGLLTVPMVTSSLVTLRGKVIDCPHGNVFSVNVMQGKVIDCSHGNIFSGNTAR